jgi:lipooligosaccharide transport system permease protein
MTFNYTLPLPRCIAVWRRNATVWRKGALRSLLGSFMEPITTLFALGLGLGALLGEVDNQTYLAFLSSGILVMSAMNTATFEGLYMAYTRMQVQRTWDGMLAAPLGLRDVVLGEILWMGTKSLISNSAILAVSAAAGLVHSWQALWVLPIALLGGLCFGSMALLVTSYSRSYEFFVYYATLLVTPMTMLSGVYFPRDNLPEPIRQIMACLPLSHMVDVVRPLMAGAAIEPWLLLAHLAVPTAYGLLAALAAASRLERRLLR